MLTLFPGWTVARTIPMDVIGGLLSRQYTLHGGVIRWAAGTEHAGQIVRHLVPVGQSANALLSGGPLPSIQTLAQAPMTQMLAQLGLQATTKTILQIATGTILLSGLNLVVSSVGFAVINHKLNKLDARLVAIQKDVRAIRELLERKERAELRAAIDSLHQVELIENPTTRMRVVTDARQKLAEMVHQYADLLQNADEIEMAIAAEEYFCLVALAHARCYMEMDEMRMAQHQLQHAQQVWSTETRRIAATQLLGKHPERFLFSDFVVEAPSEAVITWLDFAHNQTRGYAWIDELRAKTKPWHRKQGLHVDIDLPKSSKEDRRQEIEVVIPALQKFAMRQRVWEGYIAQMDAFVTYNISPRAFERALTQVDSALVIDGYVILEPEQPSEPVKKLWF